MKVTNPGADKPHCGVRNSGFSPDVELPEIIENREGIEKVAENTEVLENVNAFLERKKSRPDFIRVISQNLDDLDGETAFFEDPSKPPIRGLTKSYIQWKFRRIIQHLGFRFLIFFLIIVDLCILLADLVTRSRTRARPSNVDLALDITAMIFSALFVVELLLRMAALGMEFFQRWFNILDFCIILVTFVLSVADLVLHEHNVEHFKVVLFLRLIRSIRIFRLCTETHQLRRGARQMISENKRRYQRDGFDLDLTYVTPRVIAMSYPSSGKMRFYRNNINEVVRFFETKHPGHYKIVNCCSEREYDPEKFQGHVMRFMIEDHNVPTLEEMIRFAKFSCDWLDADPENVLAVHCKGGKGRTGTMICVWMIKAGLLKEADKCLDYFGHRRSDYNVSKKFQGVETPSQCRFIRYFETVHQRNLQLPDPVHLRVSKIRIYAIHGIGKGDGSDVTIEIDQGRGNTVFVADCSTCTNCNVSYNEENGTCEIELQSCPVLTGEIRVLFDFLSPNVPRGYLGVAFYCWFHTSFIQNNRFLVPRDELDNPHKPKTWKVFQPEFAVEFLFKGS